MLQTASNNRVPVPGGGPVVVRSADPVGTGLITPSSGLPLLLQYWQVARRWRWVLLGIIAAALVAGIVVTLLMTSRYTAAARVDISREQKKVTNVQGVESVESGRDLEFYQTQYALLGARTLAARVEAKLNLANDNSFFGASGSERPASVADVGGGSSTRSLAARERAIGILLRDVAISPVRGSSLVDVRYTSGSAELAARIANAWANEFIQWSTDRRYASTSDARDFLERRLADLRGKVESSERALANYASSKNIVSLGEIKNQDGTTQTQQTLASSDLIALNEALGRATADRYAAEGRARAGADDAGAGSPASAAAALRQRRAEIAAEYSRVLVQFDPLYPQARALSQQMKSLDAAIGREEARVQEGRSDTYRAAVQRESSLRARVQQLTRRLDQQRRDSIQYNIYQRDADTNRELYNALLQRFKEIGVVGVGASNVAVVDAAEVPGGPSSPSLPLNLALALVLGTVLAAAAVFALEQIDEGLRDPADVSRELDVPCLGGVPEIDHRDARIAVSDPKSTLAEAYFSIRSNLGFTTDHGLPRSISVTSTRAAEGKTTTSFAIASIVARTGLRVLLIDADLRSPSLHRVAEISNERGLSNFLAGEDDWQALVASGPMPGLSVMPSGPIPPSAPELLSGDRLLALIEQATQDYDHVIVDSPPVLGLADAPLIGRVVEGCVFVSMAGGVPVRGIRAALDRLRAVNIHLLGVVLTRMRPQHGGYGYGYGYGYEYGKSPEAA